MLNLTFTLASLCPMSRYVGLNGLGSQLILVSAFCRLLLSQARFQGHRLKLVVLVFNVYMLPLNEEGDEKKENRPTGS